MGGGQRPEPGVNGNWECEECKNVNFPRRWACYTIQSGVLLLYLKHNREKMAEQREHGGNFHYECRLHGGNPSWSYLKNESVVAWGHTNGLVSVLAAHGYVTLYEVWQCLFVFWHDSHIHKNLEYEKYVNLLTEYAFTWWHSYILICTCCEVSMTAVGSGGNLWIAYMMEVMVDTLWMNSHGYCCTFSAAKVLVWLALMQSASTSL